MGQAGTGRPRCRSFLKCVCILPIFPDFFPSLQPFNNLFSDLFLAKPYSNLDLYRDSLYLYEAI